MPFYAITPYLKKLFQKYKTASIKHHFTTSPFTSSENAHSPDRPPYDSLEKSEEETTPDPKLLDNLRTTPDADLSSTLLFENSQQILGESNIRIYEPQLVKFIAATTPLGATSSQITPNSQINDH